MDGMIVIAYLISIYHTILLYVSVFFSLMSPGTVIWRLFRNYQGKVRLLNRDLICDSQTLMSLPKSAKPLDAFTNALCPFVPTFILENDVTWRKRREVFSYGHAIILKRLDEKTFSFDLESKKGNVLWDVFERLFRVSFELVFNRKVTDDEFNDIYPGLVDINKIIKRFISKPNLKQREQFYRRIKTLIENNRLNEDFLFGNYKTFYDLDEIHQVSSVGEDFLITMSVQCTDLVCHLLTVYSKHTEEFTCNPIEHCLNETLRLYPLTDLWTRPARHNQRAWIASLVQLNRNGWSKPDEFIPQRWNETDHPLFVSWGFDARRCPAQILATNVSLLIFNNIIQRKDVWIKAASNFEHERTFPYGCQLWIGYGQMPKEASQWKFDQKFQMMCRRWLFEKLRMIDQNELN